jgi:hypothetical protein
VICHPYEVENHRMSERKKRKKILIVDVNYEVFREQFPSLEVECFIPKPAEIGEIIMRVNREILSNSP